eukprot:CAMPEP_0175061084 /NCGR_PEP_ID=MMETSP0052_2-20121109/13391_1 /TAXON_ID=51329 ORGANISM="Polytomella parva, Strain SAG 63-3" /NCGR_SAMPLE_ID=MMETSP0052_2 /ASSEMBLY_ACC=CAM_ASM_000194 /LENGTH=623 /DNA_ID=CAMNT_0016326905 /DNA_START=311 /DNA_END=2182 /DNA_ORIENTATION=+
MTVPESWSALMSGHSGIRPLRESDLPKGDWALLSSAKLLPVAAGVVDRARVTSALDSLGEDPKRTSLFMQYALIAADEALRDANWIPKSKRDRRNTGVVIGSGMSCTAEVVSAGRLLAEPRGYRRLTPFFVPRILANLAAGAVSIRWGFRGPNHCASTACATGAHAIGDAFTLIQRGQANVMVAGATEACIDALGIAGFCKLRALSSALRDGSEVGREREEGRRTAEEVSRPFDARRDGFVMGEGAGVLVLEDLDHALARGAKIYAEVRGYGLSGDAFHITRPHPRGQGAYLALRRAVFGSRVQVGSGEDEGEDASAPQLPSDSSLNCSGPFPPLSSSPSSSSGLPLAQLVYVNAHATSTPVGDQLEILAIQKILESQGLESKNPLYDDDEEIDGNGDDDDNDEEDDGVNDKSNNDGNGKGVDGDSDEQSDNAEEQKEDSDVKEIQDESPNPYLAVSSTKGATGHLLGAAGAVEAIFTILALKHGRSPPNLNLHHPVVAGMGVQEVRLRDGHGEGIEKGFVLTPKSQGAGEERRNGQKEMIKNDGVTGTAKTNGEKIKIMLPGPQKGGMKMYGSKGEGGKGEEGKTEREKGIRKGKHTRKAAISNSFGFGGTNAALVFSDYEE